MSAVLAVVGPLRSVDRQWLADATVLSRRGGPDGSDTRTFASAGLGRALLRLEPDEVAGPVTLDGRAWVAADVRLDARDELRRRLAGRGEGCRPGATDAELVLRAHRAWGAACAEHLLGDFAFALWDDRRGELLCARDQLGVAPLHVAQAGPCLIVASLLDAILLHPDVDDELDDEAIATFLVDGVPSDHIQTAYAHVRRLPPAHTLEWTAHATTRRRYWQLDPHPPLLLLPRTEDYVELFADALDTAVADRIRTNAVSAHLSGGLDSGAIVASAATLLRARGAGPGALRTVTAVLGGDSGDEEGDYAAEVRTALGVDGTVVDATDAQPTDPFAPPDIRLPEPAPYQRNDLQLRIARASIPSAVVLTGLGGDVLLGFVAPWWIDAALRGRPVWVARALLERTRLCHERPRPGVRAILAALRSRPPPIPAAGWVAHQGGRAPVPRRRELTPPRLPRFDLRDFVTDPMWPTIATLGHPTTTGLPLRLVHPFYDLRLVSLAAGLSPDLWLRGKRILREATRDRLPERVRQRPKTPLVSTVAPECSAIVSAGLRELVLLAPELDRFVDRRQLLAAAACPPADDFSREASLSRGLGLAHWLTHRRSQTIVNSG